VPGNGQELNDIDNDYRLVCCNRVGKITVSGLTNFRNVCWLGFFSEEIMSEKMKFSQLSIPPEMVSNFDTLKYHFMTPVQQEVIPHALEGRDLLVQAKTGSGKTAAFGTGILCNLDEKLWRVQALILCPTRELADQVTKEMRKIARYKDNIKILSLCGGLPIYLQELSLSHQAHIVVGTPGRVEKLLRNGSLSLRELTMFVLDEADRMLDAGFIDSITSILVQAPENCQKMMFSATFPDSVKDLAHTYLKKAKEVSVDLLHNEGEIVHKFYSVKKEKKLAALSSLLKSLNPERAFVLCNTKVQCDAVADFLSENSFSVFAIHGDVEQRERTEVMIRLANHSMSILVATDVAARGIDIKDLEVVINFDMPFESEVYVHRSGRTARAGKSGAVYSFLTQNESFRIEKLNTLMSESFVTEDFEISDGDNEDKKPVTASMVTISINGGRKSKVSPGHILGALTGENGLQATDVGKIDCLDLYSYIAIRKEVAIRAEKILRNNPIKGKRFTVRVHV
jgi:ATP-independent RNA helicase DbpA